MRDGAVVAVDGMGCNTGFYIIMFDKSDGTHYTVFEIRDLMLECLHWIMLQYEVPATTPATCGNYHYHNLEMALYWASEFYLRLFYHFECDYKYLEVKLDNGMTFQDS